ncbi:acyl--CoA ligase [Octadecabacter sp. SW4]|uniref:class I adenylate-forming enzyme family protein n=1 Tax=Octadecabacter sp. SW4 TaxID=2602067 RepID=UPI0011C1E949|nr:class I adenylate-forming enzyme family protein [Octadecabacter sp. SW4]QEE35557.1 acyl--CoA ligase [Octadecabacter sp. SW4]
MSPRFNMAAYVLRHASTQPDKVALSVLGPHGCDDLRYGDLHAAVAGTATGLISRGLRPGDQVLMRLGNTPEFPIVYLACIMAGLIPVVTSAQLTAREITAICADLDPKLIVAAPDVALPDGNIPVIDLAMVADFHTLPAAAPVMGDPNRPAYIIFTSGTAGKPRAVLHAHRAILARQMMWDGWEGLRPDDRLLHAGAFNWTYTLGTGLLDPWAIGATALIAAPATTDMPALMKRHRATIFAAAPGVYRQLLKSKIAPLPALRHGLSAGEKLPATIRAQWRAATGTEIHEAFGMSECSTFLSGSPARPAPDGTLGYPQDGRRVALIANGAPADAGVIAVHRDDPGLMLGYVNHAEETAAKFSGDWFLTGDLGRFDPGGAIIYEGRSDDMLNAGGFRVSPIEVEDALRPHPAIDDIAVTEVRIKADTTVIAAFYLSADVIEDDALAAYAATRLARYKTPRLFVRVKALPRGANNKLLRPVLRQNWEAAHGQT